MAEKSGTMVTCPSAMKSVETQWEEARRLFSPAYWDRQDPEFKDMAARVYNGHQVLQEMGFQPREPRLITYANLRRAVEEDKEAKAKAAMAQRTLKVEVSPEMELSPDPPPPQAPKAAVKRAGKPQLRAHKSDKKAYRCSLCGMDFTYKAAFTRHNKVNCGKKIAYKCEAAGCTKTYVSAAHFARHVRSHGSEEPCKTQTKK